MEQSSQKKGTSGCVLATHCGVVIATGHGTANGTPMTKICEEAYGMLAAVQWLATYRSAG